MKISVIIPMYNAEKYIGECLNSLLRQTFQDFEVVVVDDCSTDNSVAIVESYAKKFDGRIILAELDKNSGGGGYIPRNIGLEVSRGEYIYFLDADDFVVETALEIFYEAAKQYSADVVYTSACYFYSDDENFTLATDVESSLLKKQGFEEKLTVSIDSAVENLERLLINGQFHMPWTKFVRRKFLIDNAIEFPAIISGGDFIWSIQVLYFAKRLLRLPIPLYFYRENAVNSVTKRKLVPNEQIATCVKAFFLGVQALRALSEKIIPLKQNPRYFQSAAAPFFQNCLNRTLKERLQLNSQAVYEILSREFDADLILPFLFSIIDEQQKENLKLQRRIAESEAEE